MGNLSEKDLEKLKKKTRDLLSLDRQRLLVRFPFTGGFIMRLDIIPVRDVRLRTAATDGQRIFFDIGFCANLAADERLFVLAHETWHCVLLHMLRLQTREAKRFNVATDMEVNYLLGKEGLKVPKFCLYPSQHLEGKSAEEIYETLKPRNPKKKEMQNGGRNNCGGLEENGGRGESGGNSGGDGKEGTQGQFDKHVYGGGEDESDAQSSGKAAGGGFGIMDQWGEVGFDRDYGPLIIRGLADKIREQIVAVAQQVQRTRGALPAHIASVVQASLKPQIRWQEVLAQFVTSCYGGSRRWLPPNRRHVSQGLYLQSSRKECLRAAVAIDTSGSTTNDLPRFFTELNSLLNTFGDYELTVIQCDAEVQHVDKFDAFNPFHNPEWETFGHGGTDFRPPFRYIAEHAEVEPSCLIYITDGCGPAPERAPNYPVLWLLTSDGEKPARWGWSIKFRPEEPQHE